MAEITVDYDNLDDHSYADVRVDGAVVASIDVSDGEVSIKPIDPNHPEDSVAEYRFDLPD